MCEGATEIGILRAINNWRISEGKRPMSYLGIRYADGTGNEMLSYVKAFNSLGYDCSLICDSDNVTINGEKENLRIAGVDIIDCDANNSIEQQIFNDVSWHIVQALVNLRKDDMGIDHADKNVFQSVYRSVNDTIEYTSGWLEVDKPELRKQLGKTAKGGDPKKGKAWFKKISLGEKVGDIILSDKDGILPDTKLRKNIDDINAWIDKA